MRKHNLFAVLLGVLCLTLGTFGFTACKHEHIYSDEWTNDATEHWHAAICAHTDEKKDTGSHTYGEWVTVKAPTETEKGKKQKKCPVCEYVVDEEIPALEHEHTYDTVWSKNENEHWHAATCEHTDEKKDFAAHTYGEWLIVKEETTEETGLKKRVCSTCDYEQTEVIPEHVHTFDTTDWVNDTTGHWHPATCKHTSEKGDFAAHNYGEWIVDKEETTEETGLKHRTCGTCQYSQEEVIPKHVHTYSDEWSKDKTNHWHTATCEHGTEKKDEAAHTFGGWEIAVAVDDNIDGLEKRKCSVCEFEEQRVIKADPTPEEDKDAQLTKFRLEAEKAVLGNSRDLDHFCTGNSLEFSPDLSGNFAVCNIGTSTITFTFKSDKTVRSKLYIRMSSQYSQNTQGELSKYADVTINGKHFVDLTQKFDPSTGEVAEGSGASYFTMVTLETKISLKEGENVIVITPVTANYLNLDYIEIDTSATLEDKTDSTVKSADFVNIMNKPTESATGTILPACKQDGCTKSRGRNLPTVSHKVYTRNDTADKATYSIELFGTQVEIVSTVYKLTVHDSTFHGGKTVDFVIPGSQVELVYEEPDGQILSHWTDVDGVELGETFVMPEKNITIKPVFIAAVPAIITLQGATLNGSNTISTHEGKKIDLSKAEIENKPEGKIVYWFDVSDRTKVYKEELYTVTGNVTLAPVFEDATAWDKINHVGKVTVQGNLFGGTGKVSGCYSLLRNNTTGAVKNGKGYYEYGNIYHFKGGTVAAPTDEMAVGSHFLTQEMNGQGLPNANVDERTITFTVENFGTEDVTLRFALIKQSGNPEGSQYGTTTQTIPAGQAVTFSIDITYIHGSIMLNMKVEDHAVNEVFLGVYEYITLK